MLCKEGKVSVQAYFGTIITFALYNLVDLYVPVINDLYYYKFISPLVFYAAINIVIRWIYKQFYDVAVRATFLGFVFALGVQIYRVTPENCNIFGLYMCVMSFFHYSEYLSIAIIQPKELSVNSFLLYHSPQYVCAAITSWIEFGIESYFLPNIKSFYYVSYTGLVICVVGEFLRKLAMMTASSNFNHLVQCKKSANHVLVTHGIYSFCRHPSYVGWFYWSIGTQMILVNPFCIVGYALASWSFFNERVRIEEITLINFFGQQYCDYQQVVGTGLPFIHGYRIKP